MTDHREFGASVPRRSLDSPFIVGEVTTSKMAYSLAMRAHPGRRQLLAWERPNHFAFTWPHADGGEVNTMLVEFHLEPAGEDTQLTITESGFDALRPTDAQI